MIIGNTVLYGATSGELYANGQAGERFAVRNSGTNAVIEGCSNNGCEYMTGGNVVILGSVGENFAAGMTGGMAFIYDKNKNSKNFINSESVIYQKIKTFYWEVVLVNLIKKHIKFTNSRLARNILSNWKNEINNFLQITPYEILDKLDHPITDEKNKFVERKSA